MGHSDRAVRFVCAGGTSVDCTLKAALMCEFVRRLEAVANLPSGEGSREEAPITIPLTVEEQAPPQLVMTKIVEYLEHFCGEQHQPSVIPKPKPDAVEHYLSPWEVNYLRSLLDGGDAWQHKTLIMVLNMADRLGLAPLRDMLLAWIATNIELLSQGKRIMEAAEEIRQFFGIPNEWTEEEMNHLSKEMALYDEEEHATSS